MTRCRLCEEPLPPHSGPGRVAVWCSERCRHEGDLETKKLTQQLREYARQRDGLEQGLARLDKSIAAAQYRLDGLTGRDSRPAPKQGRRKG